MLEQERAEAVVLSRTDAGWAEAWISGLDLPLRLPLLSIELPMAELYRRVRVLT